MQAKDHRLAAIMYTDICGFSSMLEQNESGTLEMLEYHNGLIEDQVGTHGGQVVKTVGDAYLADFRTALDATRCAVDIQRQIAAYNTSRRGQRLRIRIGIHLGDIYFLENDALGEGINIASRLQAPCKPGRICISQEVYNQVANKIDVQADALGQVQLKNISREIRAYEIGTSASEEDDSAVPDVGQSAEPEATRPRGHRSDATYEFEELKDIIVEQVREAGRRIDVNRLRRSLPLQGRAVDNILDKLADKGFLARIERDNGEVSYGVTETRDIFVNPRFREAHPHSARAALPRDKKRRSLMRFDQYRRKIHKKALKAKKELLPHVIAFAAVNGFLFLLWFITGAGFPWFLFPLCGWGIGLITHVDTVKQAQEEQRHVESLPELDKRNVKKLRRLHKAIGAFRSHLVSNAAVSGFLLMINLITSPRFLWALIPTGAMALGVLIHWASFSAKRKGLQKDLSVAIEETREQPLTEMSADTGSASAPQESTSSPLVEQAEKCRDAILLQLKELKKQRLPLTKDMEPLLESYLEQIVDLSAKDAEIGQVISGIPLADLQTDRTRLEQRMASAQSENMQKEYQRSIDEVDRQLKSVQELNDQKEVITLRMTSAVNSLKRLQLDLARMKNMASPERADANLLREKTDELSEYLHDLQQAYREIDENDDD